MEGEANLLLITRASDSSPPLEMSFDLSQLVLGLGIVHSVELVDSLNDVSRMILTKSSIMMTENLRSPSLSS